MFMMNLTNHNLISQCWIQSWNIWILSPLHKFNKLLIIDMLRLVIQDPIPRHSYRHVIHWMSENLNPGTLLFNHFQRILVSSTNWSGYLSLSMNIFSLRLFPKNPYTSKPYHIPNIWWKFVNASLCRAVSTLSQLKILQHTCKCKLHSKKICELLYVTPHP